MISALILTKNEEKNIKRCLNSLVWCDEIIIIDDFSTDRTDQVAKKSGAKVYKRHLGDDFAAQRNFGLSKAKNEWIFFIDADEIVTSALRDEIKEKIKESDIDGFYLKREDYFFGRVLHYGEAGNVKLLRLAQKNSGVWKRKVHEVWKVKGKISELNNPIIHYSHLTISDFISDINKYSTIHASENKRERKKYNFLFIIFHPIGKFFVNYFLKLGFLDGKQGFIMALMMSFHSFLSWSKLWMD